LAARDLGLSYAAGSGGISARWLSGRGLSRRLAHARAASAARQSL
jgi:hypothetical protein